MHSGMLGEMDARSERTLFGFAWQTSRVFRRKTPATEPSSRRRNDQDPVTWLKGALWSLAECVVHAGGV